MGIDALILKELRGSAVHLTVTDLATQLGVALGVIELRLGELREAGFEIEDRPGYGLRLIGNQDRLIGDDLLSRIGNNSLVREILVFQETDSTNEFLMQRGRQGVESGLVMFAERQTAGRGRFGRRWDSASGKGVWFSLLLRPSLPFVHWPRLTTWAAVSVAAAIEESIASPASIKWPNDVFLGEKKVAGILAELGTDSEGRPFAVVGIGVNVNHELRDFPEELQARAGSLREFGGRIVDRPSFAATLLRALDAQYSKLGSDFGGIVAEAGRRSFLLGRWIQVNAGGDLLEGVAEELDEDGHLLLRAENGETRLLTAGEVTIAGRRKAEYPSPLF